MLNRDKHANPPEKRSRAWAVALAVVLVLSAASTATAQDAVSPDTAAATIADQEKGDTVPATVLPAVKQEEDLLAEETAAEENAPDLPNMGSALLKMVVFMILLLGVLVVGAVVFQRWARGRISLGGPKRPLRVVDRLTLGPKTGVCLVNACGRYLVLGVAEKEISVLLEVPMTPEDEENADFSGMLSQAGGESDVKPSGKDGK